MFGTETQGFCNDIYIYICTYIRQSCLMIMVIKMIMIITMIITITIKMVIVIVIMIMITIIMMIVYTHRYRYRYRCQHMQYNIVQAYRPADTTGHIWNACDYQFMLRLDLLVLIHVNKKGQWSVVYHCSHDWFPANALTWHHINVTASKSPATGMFV